jgi:hypothetical protein
LKVSDILRERNSLIRRERWTIDMKTVSLDLGSLRVVAGASKDLKTGTELERIWLESRRRKAVPPPVCLCLEHGETGQEKLSREKRDGLSLFDHTHYVLPYVTVWVLCPPDLQLCTL